MLPGIRFGRAITLEPTEKRIDSKVVWKCKCDCGNIFYTAARNLVLGDTTSCGCRRKEMLQNGLTKLEAGFSSFNQLLSNYKRAARKRGLSFELSREEFFEITQKDCYYCGINPNQIQKVKSGNGIYIYNGIDRLDNSKGYVKGNCVPCCGNCNRAKSNKSFDEFKTWIINLYNTTILEKPKD